jgi:hypothetical protein
MAIIRLKGAFRHFSSNTSINQAGKPGQMAGASKIPQTRNSRATRRVAEAGYRPIAGGFSNMDNSKQKTTKTASPAATIIWTTSPLALP